MKKLLVWTIIFILVASITRLNLVAADSSIIKVPDDYPTIQEAINAASDGDTILVRNGTYYENVVINKAVSLIGENKSTTIIDGNKTGHVVDVVSNNAVVSEFTITNGVAGLRISGSNVEIDNNVILKNDNGIWMYSSSGNAITNNLIVNSTEIGVRLVGTRNAFLRNNTIANNSVNFAVAGDSYSAGAHFVHDVDVSNTVDGKPIYYLIDQRDKQIPLDAGYVALIDSSNITVKDLNLTKNGQGILLFNSNNTIIENVTIHIGMSTLWAGFGYTIDAYGIVLIGRCDNNTIIGNSINPIFPIDNQRYCGSGGMIIEGSNNVVANNTVSTRHSIGVTGYWYGSSYARNNTIANNTMHSYVDFDSSGLGLGNAIGTLVSHNSISNRAKQGGIRIGNGVNGSMIIGNTVDIISSTHQMPPASVDNIIVANNVGKIDIIARSLFMNNKIYHNNFGSSKARANSTMNTWDDGYPSGGNYWADYDGVDVFSGPYQNLTCSDGIGDSPYVIDENNQDNYPLMNPWTEGPNFFLSVCPPSQSINPGQSSTHTVKITPINGFSSPVSLSLSGLPINASYEFDPVTITPPINGSAQSSLTITTEPTVAPDTYTLYIIASSGEIIHWTDVTLIVTEKGEPENEPPNPPSQPSGPTSITIPLSESQTELASFSTSTTDPDGDQISIVFDWGDGTTTSTDFFDSGSTIEAQYAWSFYNVTLQGSLFPVKSRAVDIHGATSEWSEPLAVSVNIASTSEVWTGYHGSLISSNSFTAISGKWNVPTVTGWGESGTWIGIGGIGDTPLLQVGTSEISLGSVFIYTAFYENYPDLPVIIDPINYPVYAGDTMEASIVHVSDNKWTLTLRNLSPHGTRSPWTWSHTEEWRHPPDQGYADWIHEVKVGLMHSITPFTSITFSEAKATINGEDYLLGELPNTQLFRDLIYDVGTQYTDVSELSNYSEFTIEYVANGAEESVAFFDLSSAANLSVYDSEGRHIGYNQTTGNVDLEIPGALWFANQTNQYLILINPNGNFTISLVGTEDGEYHLHYMAFSKGSIVQDQWLNGTISPNQKLEFSLEITTFPDGTIESSTITPFGYPIDYRLYTVLAVASILIIVIASTIVVYRRKRTRNRRVLATN